MPQLAAGSVAVITGGASGFGYQMALQLQEIGLHIALLDWEQGAINIAVPELEKNGRAAGYLCDVSSLAAVQAAADGIAKDFEGCPIGFVGANAGVGGGGGGEGYS
jgi:NAD(P)-dependent dehydrogenase (short-subunit alcohol dehydrogenase family)